MPGGRLTEWISYVTTVCGINYRGLVPDGGLLYRDGFPVAVESGGVTWGFDEGRCW